MNAVDLFSGAGGAARGLHAAGIDVMNGVDHDPDALQSYNESLPSDPILHDLRIVRPSILPPVSIDIVHGSPPCQGFSQAKGYRDPSDDRNGLVWTFIDWIDALRPRAATMENVPGMATITTTFMDEVIGAFRDIGYTARWRELNAADYGVPQTRERIFVIALRNDEPTPSRWFPRPTHAKTPTTTLDGRVLAEWRTVREAIGNLYAVPDGGVMTSQQNEGHQAAGRRDLHPVEEPARTIRGGTAPLVVPNHDPADGELSEKAIDYLTRDPRHLEKHRPRELDEPSRTIPANIHKGVPYGLVRLPNHDPVTPSKEVRERMMGYEPGETYGSVTESRLAADAPSRTLAVSGETTPIVGSDVAAIPNHDRDPGDDPALGGAADHPSVTVSSRNQLQDRNIGGQLPMNVRDIRRLTVREAARLQSFPDDHYFCGTKTSQLQQVGNAVPPLLMYHLARHLRIVLEDGDRA